MFLTKKKLFKLAAPYLKERMSLCYATSQSMGSPSSKVVLIINESELILLFLNFFQTKVIQQQTIKWSSVRNSEVRSGGLAIDVVWHVTLNHTQWRFRIVRKILTLGNLQNDFIKQLSSLKQSH